MARARSLDPQHCFQQAIALRASAAASTNADARTVLVHMANAYDLLGAKLERRPGPRVAVEPSFEAAQ